MPDPDVAKQVVDTGLSLSTWGGIAVAMTTMGIIMKWLTSQLGPKWNKDIDAKLKLASDQESREAFGDSGACPKECLPSVPCVGHNMAAKL